MEKEKEVLELFQNILRHYGFDQIALSFNGGKDSTVMLHLYQKALMLHEKQLGLKDARINGVFFRSKEEFPEVLQFIDRSIEEYQIDMVEIEAPIKEGLQKYCQEHPAIKAICIGSRWTDPAACRLKPVQPTDAGWAPVMRVHPLLSWTLQDIWQYIEHYEVKYCKLYDLGYTSLGDSGSSRPNPLLRCQHQTDKYLPAKALSADEYERLGRDEQKLLKRKE